MIVSFQQIKKTKMEANGNVKKKVTVLKKVLDNSPGVKLMVHLAITWELGDASVDKLLKENPEIVFGIVSKYYPFINELIARNN